jgi:ribonuclease HI
MEERLMRLILANIFVGNNAIAESLMDQEVLKELPFAAKTVAKLPGGAKDVNYDIVAFPLIEGPAQRNPEEVLLEEKLNQKMSYGDHRSYEVLRSVAEPFKRCKALDVGKVNMMISVLGITEEYDITYTDGSFKKATDEASYGVVKMLQESAGGLTEEFTGRKYDHSELSGKIPSGTNNVGELTALKIAAENFSGKKYQVIISDSEYGIKSLREWFYTWRENNFRNYAKKTIANKDLIISIADAISASGKIVLFKWVKGHSSKTFNELCDELAKKALDISK